MILRKKINVQKTKLNVVKCLMPLIVIGISACGHEEASNTITSGSDSITESPRVIAPELVIITKPNEINEFNIRQHYVGKGITIDSISSENEHCYASQSHDDINTAELYSNAAEFCTYSISVGNSENNEQTQTSLTSFSSLADKPILEPQFVLLKQAEMLDQNVIDVKSVLGEQWPQGYELKAVTRVSPSNEHSAIPWSQHGIELSYGQVNEMITLRYVLANKESEDKPLTGLIVVGKGIEKTYADISPISYNLDTVFTAKTQQQLTINLETLSDLTIDIDSQWQLAYVYSNTATVASADKDSVINKSFTFIATQPGKHSVSYVVQDQYNNILSASMYITVAANEQTPDWNYVDYYNSHTNTTKRLAAPLLYSDASQVTNAEALWDSNKSTTLSAYLNADSAETICAAKGRIPFAYELDQVYRATSAGELDISKWPKSTPFMVYSEDKSRIQAYDLNTGILRDKSTEDEALYLTCLEFQELMVQTTGVTFTVYSEAQVSVVTKKAEESEYDISLVSDEISESEMTLRTVPINERQFAVYARSTKGGLFTIKVTDRDNPEITVESRLQAIVGKWKELQFSDTYTCRGTEGVRDPCYVIANDSDEIEVDFRMVDNEGNGIPDKSFSVTTDLSVTSNPWSDWTDLRGASSFRAKAKANLLSPGETEKTVGATLKKDNGELLLNIRVIAPTK